ncbi:MAG TPA: thiamine pyrophosphate-dependent dehydrogenase E1 component subunit alpha [Gammaproteobacteria bacterium]|nr:thiamine pyrophosphate-dependent dehydrogenase E1 component subunit alpha [Gammaproteobacteria bacterium]
MNATMDELDLFHQMLRIRRVEETLAERYAEQEMRCPMHLCIGQEATAVGVISALAEGDRVFSGHRAHGHYLATGGDLTAMIAELYGRASGCSQGRGGSMHLIDTDAGFMGSTAIVGGTVPVAVGAAWASQLRDEGRVVCLFFGDGCFEQGVLHESMNFAALHRLPILFVCENNHYAVYTPLEERQPTRPIHAIASAHGLHAQALDGNHLPAVRAAADKAVHGARIGDGPQFLELHTWRWREHCGPDVDDHLGYRTPEAQADWLARCPIEHAAAHLCSLGLLDEIGRQHIENAIQYEIEHAFDSALRAPLPRVQDMYGHLHGR